MTNHQSDSAKKFWLICWCDMDAEHFRNCTAKGSLAKFVIKNPRQVLISAVEITAAEYKKLEDA